LDGKCIIYKIDGNECERKYVNENCVEMIGLIWNMLEIIEIVRKIMKNIRLEKENNLELGRD